MSDTTRRLRELVRGWEHAEQMNGCDLPAPVTGKQLAAMLDVVDAAELFSDEDDSCITYPACGGCRYCTLDSALARFREVSGE